MKKQAIFVLASIFIFFHVEPVFAIADGRALIQASASTSILWDASHGQYGYVPNKWFKKLSDHIAGYGFEIDTTYNGFIVDDPASYDIAVICTGSSAYSTYTTEEVEKIKDFVVNGGGLLILGEHVGSNNDNLQPVASAFGITLGVSTIRNGYSSTIYTSDFTSHLLFDGIRRICFQGAGELSTSSDLEEIAWAEGTDKALVVAGEYGHGRVVALGDSNVFSSFNGSGEYYDRVDNRQFSVNTFEYLAPAPTYPPVGDAGDDEVVIDFDDDGSEEVTLDGSDSTDSDGNIVSWVWTDDLGDTIPDGEIVTADLSVGVHTITLTVTDDDGSTDSDIVVITVEARTAMTWYVDDGAAGLNSGFSWEDAFTEFQLALDVAIAGDQIWVAEGTYKPTIEVGGSGNRYKTFQMKNGAAIYGGYAGWGAADPDERDVELHETILSGDLLGNDNPAIPIEELLHDPIRADNCYHVFYHPDGLGLDPNAILDGFTITGGNAAGLDDHDDGGGMFNDGSSPTLTNCTFSGNSAVRDGGGMCNESSSPTVTTCTFSGNSAANLGGGMYNVESSPIVTNCTFSGNSAFGAGGGMLNWQSSPTITNCILWGNTARNYNEICSDLPGIPIISYCNIKDCGGSGAYWDSSLGTDGGGNIDTDPMFVDAAGGDLHLQNTSPCINAGDNNAPSLAVTDFEGDPRIIHSIVDMGVDEVAGEVLFSVNVAIEPFARICTVTLDPAGGVYPPGTEVTITVDIEADYEEGFVFDGWSGDLSGNENPAAITIDAHKYITANFVFDGDIIYVDADAEGSNTGMSWADAFNNLYDALPAAASGDKIRVAGGTYNPDTAGLGNPKAGAFSLVNGVTVKGGYAGWGAADPDARDVAVNETILSGDLLGNDDSVMLFGGDDPFTVWYIDPNRIENCYHVFYHHESLRLDPNAVLDGFTVTGGTALGSYSSQYGSGGGMYNSNGSPTVTNCIFSSNLARDGAGIYNDNSSPTVTNCIFSDNLGLGVAGMGGSGGGICNWNNSNPTVSNSIFSDNSAARGGGIYNDNSNPIVTNCIFSGNSALHVGGGMCNWASSPTVTNCTFIDNWVDEWTFYEQGGGGMYNSGGNPVVTNCILWGNTALSGGNEIALEDSSTIDIDHCDVQGGEAGIYDDGTGNTINWGGGNIDIAPMFIDAEGGDLRLMSSSPCIDAGDDSVVTVATDMDGNPRVMGAAVDMGAYEFVSLPPIEAVAYIFPRVLNVRSRGRYVIARMELPDGILADDVESDSFTLIIGDTVIESVRQRGIGYGNRHYVFGFFDRSEVIAQADGKTKLDIVIAGELTTGQCVYGEDSIKIVKSQASQKKTLRRMPARNNRGGRKR